MTTAFLTGSALFGTWFEELERGEPPVRFVLPSPFASLDIRPGRMMLFGGPPGGGAPTAIITREAQCRPTP